MASARVVVGAAMLAAILSSASAFHMPALSVVGRTPSAVSLAARMRPRAASVANKRASAGALQMTIAKEEEKTTATGPSEAEQTAKKVADPTSADMAKLNLGLANMMGELEDMRTADVLKAWKEGKIGKRQASTLTLKRLGKKLGIGGGKSKGNADDDNVNQAIFMEGGWAKRGKGSSIVRTIELYSFGIKIILRELKLRKVEDKAEKSEARKLIAKDLRAGLLELGPTFIKLGQLLSTRIDILTKEYIDELKILQDNVPGFSGDVAVATIERELGKPINEIFESFDKRPIAAASLGQVHKAVLKGSGQEVAVKVQRTGLDDLFKNDLQNLKFAAKVCVSMLMSSRLHSVEHASHNHPCVERIHQRSRERTCTRSCRHVRMRARRHTDMQTPVNARTRTRPHRTHSYTHTICVCMWSIWYI